MRKFSITIFWSTLVFPSFSISDNASNRIRTLGCPRLNKVLHGVVSVTVWALWKWRYRIVNGAPDAVMSLKGDTLRRVCGVVRSYRQCPPRGETPMLEFSEGAYGARNSQLGFKIALVSQSLLRQNWYGTVLCSSRMDYAEVYTQVYRKPQIFVGVTQDWSCVLYCDIGYLEGCCVERGRG
ncbi:hypothetical protein Tco_0277230 [Tanacetum coccineum]